MIIEYPYDSSLNKLADTYLWRYISLHKLIYLLNYQRIYFTRFDHFEDGIEGLTGSGIVLKAFTQGTPLTYNNVNKSVDIKTQQKLIDADNNRRQEYLVELTNSQQTQFASCWYMGLRESIAMWKLYSQKEGVAIKFKAKQLTETIIAAAESYTNTDFHYLYFGPVVYKNIWPFDLKEKFDGKFNGLKKDKSYVHENEFRFVAVVPISEKGKYQNFTLPIGQLRGYELEIITNPYMANWEIENLRILLGKYNLESVLQTSKIEIRK